MRPPFRLDEFAALARVPVDDVERYRDAGLLDLDGDGVFDDLDGLRVWYVQLRLELGEPLEQIAEEARARGSLFASLLFRKSGRAYSLDEGAALAGLTREQIQAMRTAGGLPGEQLDDDDVAAFAGVRRVMDAGLPWEAVLEATRVYGDSLRRIAEMEIELMHRHLHAKLTAEGASVAELAQRTETVIGLLQPVIEPILTFIHRLHLVRAAAEDVLQHLESGGAAAGAPPVAVLFVDLSSFTALAHAHGDEVAAQVLDRFDGCVRALGLEHRGRIVKQIGDAFMLTFAEAGDAARFALALGEALDAETNFPPIRIGIHAGPVLYRVGDYVGATVNLASRLSLVAMPGEIVVTEPVARGAEAAGVDVEEAGVRMLRGMAEPLPLYRLRRPRAAAHPCDVVCGMRVGPQPAARLARDGTEFVFCSEECLRLFLDRPDAYATSAASRSGAPI